MLFSCCSNRSRLSGGGFPRLYVVMGLALATGWGSAVSGQTVAPSDDLTQLSVEELGALSISAASKRSQPLFQTPAAVDVLLSEDIRRYGHASVAEALRMIPGANVAEGNADHWQIGIRGFNGLSSTKLLVSVDGRNIYSPFYAGVDWAEADLPIEDIDRVEVVRGPGATLWGVNAVNGIVNITSKSARDTQGGLLAAREGTGAGLDVYARYGGALGAHTWYRVYVRTRDSDFSSARDSVLDVPFRRLLGGMRIDRDAGGPLRLTLQGEYVFMHSEPKSIDSATGRVRSMVNEHARASLLGRTTWRGSPDSELSVQIYADTARDHSNGLMGLAGGTFFIVENGGNADLDVSHHVKLAGRHDLVWGGGARLTRFNLDASSNVQVSAPKDIVWRYNFFAQDEVTLLPDRLRFTLGSKFEHHESIGWQALPSARLTFLPSLRQTCWAAASRAIRAPSRSESDVRLPLADVPATLFSPPVHIDLVGTSATREETLTAYELGWRFKPIPRLTLDATAYVHAYTHLRNLQSSTRLQYAPLLALNDLTAVNDIRATGYGFEAEATWRVSDRWQLAAGVTNERLVPKTPPFSLLIGADFSEPHLMWNARTWFALPRDFEFSAALYRVDALPDVNVPAYLRADAQLTWRPRPDLELNFGVQNAFDPAHREYGAPAVYPNAEVPRNIFGRVQWRF
jgi:iron complex outermembrane receptor protein